VFCGVKVGGNRHFLEKTPTFQTLKNWQFSLSAFHPQSLQQAHIRSVANMSHEFTDPARLSVPTTGSERLYRCNEIAIWQAWQTRQERATQWERDRMPIEDCDILMARVWPTRASGRYDLALRYLDNLNT
jgi:hypothetical protein